MIWLLAGVDVLAGVYLLRHAERPDTVRRERHLVVSAVLIGCGVTLGILAAA